MPRYWELLDHVGQRDDNGAPEPLVAIGVTLDVPTMRDGEVVDIRQSLAIDPAKSLGQRQARIVPGTRIVETNDPRVDAALASHGGLREIDPPTKKAVAEQEKSTQDAVEAAESMSDEERAA